MEKLKRMLVAKGLKPTYQRLKVLDYLNKHTKNHPTVEMIFDALVGKIPTISITTIYNTLNAFLEKRLVSAETITGTEIRYELVSKPHHHFLCKICGRISDIKIECPLAVKEKKIIDGNSIEEVHGYFKGVCGSCYKKGKNKSKLIKKS